MSKSNLTYTGNIKVKIYDKNKKLKSIKCYHNNGRWPLFNFISNCLAGNYDEANKFRPYYVGLFSIPKVNEGQIPEIKERYIEVGDKYSNTDIQYYLSNNNSNSKLITAYFNEYSKIETNLNSDACIGDSNLTLTFEIPNSYLVLIKDEQKNWGWDYKYLPINLICLYSKGFKPSTSSAPESKQERKDTDPLILTEERLIEPLAYCFIPELDSKGAYTDNLGNLLSLDSELSDISKYNIVIEWTLNFNNNLNKN